MFHGFYNLASGMLSQRRNLNVISNNITNVTTPGFKRERHVTTTFEEEMLYRTGMMDKSNQVPLYTTAMLRSSQETVTEYGQGTFDETGGNLDFALSRPGFFTIQQEDGTNVYTRNGSFAMDEEGYLVLPGIGRVVGENGPIALPTDQIEVDQLGTIYDARERSVDEDGNEQAGTAGAVLGRLAVVDFADYDQLTRVGNGAFTAAEQGMPADGGIMWKRLEQSNVEPLKEMTDMISSQKAFQSSSQMFKMYDQLMGRIVSDIGKL